MNLSYAYFTGQGVEKNVDKAIELASSVIKDPENIGYANIVTTPY
ncbi:SEL1-like repeat protein [Avibacterium avium]